ncbi:Crp/Fnr family transcriptional regulator [Erwiniaceae bacterium L1_54_6]|jgi:CRP-like cAMP-binding protein|nr:Crp/Fnr family transcriptional regulator [Erwiniaceae bacterium L1_54_6]
MYHLPHIYLSGNERQPMEIPKFYFSHVFDDLKPLFAQFATGRKSFKKGELIFSSESPLDFCLLIEKGLSSYSVIHESGAVKTLFYHAEGSLFPTYSSLRTYRLLEYNMAVTDVEGLILPQKKLAELMQQHPELMQRVLSAYLDMFNFLLFDSINQSYNSAFVRVCNFLYLYSEYMQDSGMQFYDINLTHEEISNVVAVSRVQVSYIISKLKKESVISSSRGRIRVENKKMLGKYCSGETLG